MNIIGFVILSFLLLPTQARLERAERVLTEADSLRSVGVLYDDSVQLAQAAEAYSFPLVQYHCPDEYQKANYYYGRLLREHDDPVAAVQAFFTAIHTYGRDYTTKGRCYSNIGTMCHLAQDYALAYTYYEKSAKQFQKGKQTTLYLYGLNNMAFEMAEQRQKDATIELLKQIADLNTDRGVAMKTWETYANLYYKFEQYDSTLYYIDKLQENHYEEPTGYVLKSQAFYKLQELDSALYYAKKVMTFTQASAQDRYNMLYVLSNTDSTLTLKSLNNLVSERSDIHINEIDKQKEQLAEGIAALYDLEGSYYIPWYWWGSGMLIVLGISVVLGERNEEAHFEQINEQIQKRNIEKLTQERDRLAYIVEKLGQQQEFMQNALRNQLDIICKQLQSADRVKTDLCWGNYKELCEIVDDRFFHLVQKLKTKGVLKDREIRLCILVLIDGFTSSQMSQLLYYAESGIRNFKHRTAVKLGTDSSNLRSFLIDMILPTAEIEKMSTP